VSTVAEVTLWGDSVGALLFNPDTGLTTFEYFSDWVKTGFSIAPLHLPTRPGRFTFAAMDRSTFFGLPGALADTLPDDFGNAVIDAWLARQGIDKASFSPVDRLLYTGVRGMGALEYQPSTQNNRLQTSEDIEVGHLVELAQSVLDQRAGLDVALSAGDDSQDAMSEIFQVGTSAGGARPKAVIALNDDRSRVLSGQVSVPSGFTHYLIKFDGVRERSSSSEIFGDPLGYGRMEYAYYLMAKSAGINMTHSELLLEGNRAHFITQRFDREGDRKKHYQSLCAMDHADFRKPGQYSYEELLRTARALRLPREDAIEIFRRMVFNVVARNQDDHTKNFGFIMDTAKSGWRLAPAFDVAYSYKPGSYWVDTHQMTINGKRDGFTRQDLLAVAKPIGQFSSDARKMIDQVIEVVSQWLDFADQAEVDPRLKSEIRSNLRLSV
jgi:serine/threonine-protein kinase HipA